MESISCFWFFIFRYSIFFFSYRDFVIESWLCWPVSMLILYFFLANFSWMFCVAFNFYQMIVRRNRESEALEKWYHVGCWGAPLIVVICVAATGKFGRVGDPANLYDKETFLYISVSLTCPLF